VEVVPLGLDGLRLASRLRGSQWYPPHRRAHLAARLERSIDGAQLAAADAPRRRRGCLSGAIEAASGSSGDVTGRAADAVEGMGAGARESASAKGLAVGALRQSGRALGQLAAKHLVHAAVDAGVDPGDRRAWRSAWRFRPARPAAFAHGVGDSIRMT